MIVIKLLKIKLKLEDGTYMNQVCDQEFLMSRHICLRKTAEGWVKGTDKEFIDEE